MKREQFVRLLNDQMEKHLEDLSREGMSEHLSAQVELHRRFLEIGHLFLDTGHFPKEQLQDLYNRALLLGAQDGDFAKDIKAFIEKYASRENGEE